MQHCYAALGVSVAPIAHTSPLIVSPLPQLITSEPLFNLPLGQRGEEEGVRATGEMYSSVAPHSILMYVPGKLITTGAVINLSEKLGAQHGHSLGDRHANSNPRKEHGFTQKFR